MYAIPCAIEGHVGLRPKTAQQPDLLFDPPAANVEGRPQRFVLDGIPPDAYSQAQSSTGQQVELGGLLGHENRLTLRQNEDAGRESNAVRTGRDPGEEHERFMERMGEVVRALPIGPGLPFGTDHMVEHQEMGVSELLYATNERRERLWVAGDLTLWYCDADSHPAVTSCITMVRTWPQLGGFTSVHPLVEVPVRVLVTGALGFVAVNVIRHLADAGHSVLAVDRARPDALAQRFLQDATALVTHVTADLVHDDWSATLPAPAPDIVIHAAAITPLGEFEARQALLAAEVNTVGTARVFQWAAASSVPRMIHVSTGSVYGPVDGEVPVDEDVPHRPNTIYGITKSAGERLAWRLAEIAGQDLIVLRLSHIYGPMERASEARRAVSPIERWTRAMIEGSTIESPRADQLRDFLHVSDVARAIVMLVDDDRSTRAVYNVSSGRVTSEEELVDQLRAIDPDLKIGDGGGAGASSSDRRVPLAIERIVRETGWRPSLELNEGLRSYVEWRRTSDG